MLPFEPEDLDRLRARLPAALEPVYEPEECAKGAVRPGELRRHVFDWPDGLRLILSRDLFDGHPKIHVSASVVPDTAMWCEIAGITTKALDARTGGFFLHASVANRLDELLEQDLGRRLKFIGSSPQKGVPHWVIEERTGA